MKNNDMTGLLNLAYEIEGLLMLHINRGDEAAPEMRQLLVDKAARLLDGLKSESADAPAETDAAAPAPVCCEPQPAAPVAASAETADEKAIAASAIVEETEDAAGDEPAPAAEPEPAPAPAAVEETPAPATVNDTLVTETPLTLDERLARERAADISKAFTLNDRFRFRRELFNGNDSDLSDTLMILAGMESYDEAADYLLGDMMWDKNNASVADFMAILAQHMPR